MAAALGPSPSVAGYTAFLPLSWAAGKETSWRCQRFGPAVDWYEPLVAFLSKKGGAGGRGGRHLAALPHALFPAGLRGGVSCLRWAHV